MTSRMVRHADRINRQAATLRCPHCGEAMAAVQNSVQCTKGHAFDIARQGYVNLATRPVKTSYDKALFAARHRIIGGSGLFDPLHREISAAICRRLPAPAPSADQGSEPLRMADLGCGEGTHLEKIAALCREAGHGVMGTGLDLSRAGIRLAASRYPETLWLVGDLARPPLAPAAFHVVLNILSPANYGQFRRLLAPGGVLIKVVPGPDYLRELREALHPDTADQARTGEENTARLFAGHFPVHEAVPLRYGHTLEQEALRDLPVMSPLGWTAEERRIEAFANRQKAEITVDLLLLIATV